MAPPFTPLRCRCGHTLAHSDGQRITLPTGATHTRWVWLRCPSCGRRRRWRPQHLLKARAWH